MAQLFAVKTNHGYQKPNLEVVLMDADCIESLLGSVRRLFKIFGVNPFVCIKLGFVCMHFEVWELENLNSKRLINDFFQMYGESGMIETGDLYMDIPVEALLLLDKALAGQMKQDFDAFI
jgi:hypothetical protein